MLTRSFVRRKQFEARLIAIAVGEMLFGSSKKGSGGRRSTAQEVSPERAFAILAGADF